MLKPSSFNIQHSTLNIEHSGFFSRTSSLKTACSSFILIPVEWIFALAALALGAIIGSFLNVVIHRYPREESIVFPASRCPTCHQAIKPYDNVPVLSWLWLRGRCRNCRQPISLRYPLVELANGLFYLALYQRTGPTIAFLPLAALVSMTIVLIYIDAEIQMLPDVITYSGLAIGLGAAALGIAGLAPDLMLAEDWVSAVIGAVVGGGTLAALILAYWLIRKVEGMGWGDVKMIAMIGALLGFAGLPPLLLISSVTGAAVGIPLAMRHEKGMQVALPFGVFLGFGTLILLFFGRTLSSLWVQLVLPH